MAVICLTSASGSPGVTTTAVGLAFCWPRPVLLVEADPTGGSGILAGIPARHDAVRRRADRARALAAGHGGRAAGRRTAAEPERLPRRRHPVACSGRGAARCVGAAGRGTRATWTPTGRTSSSTPAGSASSGRRQPLLDAADVTLLVTRATLPSISAARSWAETVRQPATGWRHPGLLLDRRRPAVPGHRGRQGARHARRRRPPRRPGGRGCLPPRSARRPRHFETGPYVRGLQAAVAVDPGARRSRSVRPRRGGARDD